MCEWTKSEKGQRVNSVPRSLIWQDKTFHYIKWPQGWKTKGGLFPLGVIRTPSLVLMQRFNYIHYINSLSIYYFLILSIYLLQAVLCFKIRSQSKYAKTCRFTKTTNQLLSFLPDPANTDVCNMPPRWHRSAGHLTYTYLLTVITLT